MEREPIRISRIAADPIRASPPDSRFSAFDSPGYGKKCMKRASTEE